MNTATAMTEPNTDTVSISSAKVSDKSLREQIGVVAEFHAHKIHPLRIAYRTGINLQLVQQLINGDSHQGLFKALLAHYRKDRRDQRLQESLRHKGIARAALQQQIEQEYLDATVKPSN